MRPPRPTQHFVRFVLWALRGAQGAHRAAGNRTGGGYREARGTDAMTKKPDTRWMFAG
jgi:hypothetical protein